MRKRKHAYTCSMLAHTFVLSPSNAKSLSPTARTGHHPPPRRESEASCLWTSCCMPLARAQSHTMRSGVRLVDRWWCSIGGVLAGSRDQSVVARIPSAFPLTDRRRRRKKTSCITYSLPPALARFRPAARASQSHPTLHSHRTGFPQRLGVCLGRPVGVGRRSHPHPFTVG